MRFHLLEDLLHRVEHNARVLFISQHGVGLASSSLSICKNSRVVAIQHSFAKKLGGVLEHFQLLRVFVKCEIKGILFLLGSILSKHLLLVHNIGWVHQYNNVCLQDLDDAYFAFLHFLLPHRAKSDRDHDFIYSLSHFAYIVLVSRVTTSTIAELGNFPFFRRTSKRRMVLPMTWIPKFTNLRLVKHHGFGIGMRQILTFVIHLLILVFIILLN